MALLQTSMRMCWRPTHVLAAKTNRQRRRCEEREDKLAARTNGERTQSWDCWAECVMAIVPGSGSPLLGTSTMCPSVTLWWLRSASYFLGVYILSHSAASTLRPHLFFQCYIFLVDVLVSFLPLGQNPRENPLKRRKYLYWLSISEVSASFGPGAGSILDSIHTLLVQSHWEPAACHGLSRGRRTSCVEALSLGASEYVYICRQSFWINGEH